MANFNFNKAILGGRLTADPELKMTNADVPVTSITIAVQRKGKQGDEPHTDFIDCVAWRDTAQFITRYFRKGDSICVEGALQKRSYTDKQGEKRYATEVVIERAYFVDSKSERADATPTAQTTQTQMNAPYMPDAYKPAPSMAISDDDDLPF